LVIFYLLKGNDAQSPGVLNPPQIIEHYGFNFA